MPTHDTHQHIEPCPSVRDDIAELLDLRPRDRRNPRLRVPGKLIGFWRSRADWSDPEAGGVYWRAVQSTQRSIELGSNQYLSDADLRPYGGSRMAYFQAQLDRDLEKAKAHSELPWPGEHLDPSMSQEERERIAGLLDAAPIVASYRGCSDDRLAPESRTANGCGERALAGWIWPTGLSHYVRTYGLVLPPEMIANLQAAAGV